MTGFVMTSSGYPAQGTAASSTPDSQTGYSLKGKIPKEEITPEARFKKVLSNFSDCFNDYKKTTEFPLLGSLLKMDQQLKVGDMHIIADVSAKETKISGKLPCGKDGPIIVTHAFEAKSYIPIGKSEYRVVKRKDLTWEENVLVAKRMEDKGAHPGSMDSYAQEYYQEETVLDNQKFDDDGVAKINLPPCEAGHSYHIYVNSSINSPENVKMLEESYSTLITQYSALLKTFWTDKENGRVSQYQRWIEFDASDGINYEEVVNKFFSAIKDKLLELYDTVGLIYEWVSNLNYEKLQSYLGEKAIEEFKKMAEKSKKAITDTLIILCDEVLMFICAYALYSYFCLLTPQQLAAFAADMVGEFIIMIILYMVLPGGVLKFALEALDTVAGTASTDELARKEKA